MSHIVNQQWAPNYLIQSYFDQPEAWVTASGESLNVEDMDREHALNAILMVERVRTQIEPFLKCHVWETPLYQALKAHVLGDVPDPNIPEGARYTIRSINALDPKLFYLRAEPVKESTGPYWVADCCREGTFVWTPGLFTEDEVATVEEL